MNLCLTRDNNTTDSRLLKKMALDSRHAEHFTSNETNGRLRCTMFIHIRTRMTPMAMTEKATHCPILCFS